jgi:hypothetical protein
MVYKEVNNLMNSGLRQTIVLGLSKIVKSVNFDEVNEYKYGLCDFNNEYGVLRFVFGIWEWSWMETINSNTSCIHLLIGDYNQNNEINITYSDFTNNPNETINLFFNHLEKEKQRIFTPKSDIFNNLKFATQYSWNAGKSSEVSTYYTINKNIDGIIKCDLDFRRGDKEDRSKGRDFLLVTNGITKRAQNKKVKNGLLAMDGDYWYFDKMFYHEELYKNVDVLFIDDDTYIYYFDNSNDRNLCGMYTGVGVNNKFRIHDSLKNKRMKKENEEVTNLLIELNKFTWEKNIEFFYVKDDQEKNSIEFIEDNGKQVIKFAFNDIDDDKLYEKLSLFFNELKKTFQ